MGTDAPRQGGRLHTHTVLSCWVHELADTAPERAVAESSSRRTGRATAGSAYSPSPLCTLPGDRAPWGAPASQSRRRVLCLRVGSEPWGPRRSKAQERSSQPLPSASGHSLSTPSFPPQSSFLTSSWVLALLPERSRRRDLLLLLCLASDSAQDRALLEADAAHVQGLR